MVVPFSPPEVKARPSHSERTQRGGSGVDAESYETQLFAKAWWVT